MPEKKIRIALLGPESTGKSTLAEQLAQYYKTVWVPEYAREYVEKHGMKCTADDIVEIAVETKHRIKLAEAKANKILFCDTEFIYLKVWCDTWYFTCPDEIATFIEEIPFDLYLLTEPDVDWVFDNVRTDEEGREERFEQYKKEVAFYGFKCEIINGAYSERFDKAQFFIEKHFPDLG